MDVGPLPLRHELVADTRHFGSTAEKPLNVLIFEKTNSSDSDFPQSLPQSFFLDFLMKHFFMNISEILPFMKCSSGHASVEHVAVPKDKRFHVCVGSCTQNSNR